MITKILRLLGTATAFALVGCSHEHIKNQVDKDVYAILKTVEKDIFGESSQFSIDTPNSKKKPKEISAQKILNSRSKKTKLEMPLDLALDYAIKNSREYQSSKEQLYLAALNLTGEKHRFRPRFFGNTRATGTFESGDEVLGQSDTNLGFNRAIKTGGTLGVSIANDLLRYFTNDPRESAVSVLSLNIAQPLLRGAGRKIATEQLTQANRDVIYAIRDYTHFQNTFSVRIVTDYFDLLQSKDVIVNEYNNYLSRKENVAYLKARSDREKPESVGIAEQSELQAKNNYIQAITRYRNQLDLFKITLGLPQTVQLKLDDTEISRLRKSGARAMTTSNAQAFAIALKHRLPLFNQIDRFEDQKRQVAIAADQLKTELNLTSNTTLNSEGRVDYAKFDFRDVRTTLGLQLDLPLDRLRERNQYRTTLINFEAATRTLGRNFDELRNLLDQLIRELDQFRESYQIQKNAVKLARDRVEGNRLRLQAGTALFRNLSESQDALLAAQNAETQSIVNYLEARLGLLVELGILDSSQKSYWLKPNPSLLQSLAPKTQALPSLLKSSKIPTPEELFE